MPEGRDEIELTKRQVEELLHDASICASYAALHIPAANKWVYNAAWRLLAVLKLVKRPRKRASQ